MQLVFQNIAEFDNSTNIEGFSNAGSCKFWGEGGGLKNKIDNNGDLMMDKILGRSR